MKPLSSRALFTVLTVLGLVCLLRFPEEVTESALDAMELSVRRVVPLLFSYSVLSSLLVKRGRFPLSGALASLCRFPQAAGPVLLTGFVAGFPVGASGAADLCRRGVLGREEAERLAAVSSVPSPAFLVGMAGGLWGDCRFGWFLWGSAVLTLMLSSAAGRKKETTKRDRSGSDPACPLKGGATGSLSSDIGRAVTDASSACLSVTAFIVFFRVLSAVSSRLFPPGTPFFALFFEFSAGVRYAASVGGTAGAALTGAAAGFGGISVLMQVASRLSDCGLSSAAYLRSRLLLAMVLGAGAALYAHAHPLTAASPVFSASAAAPGVSCFVLFLLAVPVLLRSPREYFTTGT